MPSRPTPVVIVPGRPGLTRLDIDALTLLEHLTQVMRSAAST